MIDLEDEAINGKESVAERNVRWKAPEICAENVAYERNGLQARLQPSRSAQDLEVESFTRIQDRMDCFSMEPREDQDYMECRADENARKMLSDLCAWMAARGAEVQQTLLRTLRRQLSSIRLPGNAEWRSSSRRLRPL